MIARSPGAVPVILAASAVKVDLTGTTSETTLATIPIPAGAMGLNGGLLIYSTWTVTNSANNKILRGRLGGIAGTQFLGLVLTANATHHDLRRIRNRGSASSQVASTSASTSVIFGPTTAAVTTGTVDTSVAQDFVLTGQLALGTETCTLEGYEVWLLP